MPNDDKNQNPSTTIVRQYTTVKELVAALTSVAEAFPDMPVAPQVYGIGGIIDLKIVKIRMVYSREFINPEDHRAYVVAKIAPPAFNESGSSLDEEVTAVQITVK